MMYCLHVIAEHRTVVPRETQNILSLQFQLFLFEPLGIQSDVTCNIAAALHPPGQTFFTRIYICFYQRSSNLKEENS